MADGAISCLGYFFIIGYFLSINRFILFERDSFLADSIKRTCQANPGTTVAAVVGLLHCNGVARHLRDAGYE
jgi:pheromone shutdown protein TraB